MLKTNTKPLPVTFFPALTTFAELRVICLILLRVLLRWSLSDMNHLTPVVYVCTFSFKVQCLCIPVFIVIICLFQPPSLLSHMRLIVPAVVSVLGSWDKQNDLLARLPDWLLVIIFLGSFLHLTGSSVNGFGEEQSDVDMCLLTNNHNVRKKMDVWCAIHLLSCGL